MICPTCFLTVPNRILGVLSKIPATRLRIAGLTDEELSTYAESVEKLHRASIAVHDVNDLTVERIRDECRLRLDMHGALGLVVIDSLQQIDSQNGVVGEQAGICRKLKALAREIRCPVLLISDLPRTSPIRVDKRPILSDLGEVDRFADVVVLLYRHLNYDQWHAVSPDVVELIVVKQSDGGPKGIVRLRLNAECGALEDMSEPNNPVIPV